jgi:WD40 repeat protein
MNSIDKLICVWDRPSEAVVRELAGHETRVNSVVFAPDGKTLLSGDADGVRVVRPKGFGGARD